MIYEQLNDSNARVKLVAENSGFNIDRSERLGFIPRLDLLCTIMSVENTFSYQNLLSSGVFII